jgi:hypothetical protein
VNAVTEPEPLAVGNATVSPSRSTRDTITNSVRPSSEGRRTGTVASTRVSPRSGRPAMRRRSGATMSWKVNIAEVGKPGSTTTGLPSQAARQSGLPGLSATPCATIPGRPSPPTIR